MMSTKRMATTKTPITSTSATTATTTAAAATATATTNSSLFSVSQAPSRKEERIRPTQRVLCERERKHEAAAAKRYQEEQSIRAVGGKRQSMTTKSTLYHSRQQLKSKRKPEQWTRNKKSTGDDLDQGKEQDQDLDHDNESALRFQLKHLAHLSEEEFEKGFRQWMDQEGIAREIHAQLRTDLINSFNKTSLGRLLSKTAAGIKMDASPNSLYLSSLSMTLHTLVAEHLHIQNCHYTLSVYCSEMPHRNALPDFEGRPDFRFTCEELKEVLIAVLGKQDHARLRTVVQHLYLNSHQKDSLLFALVKCLVDSQPDNICIQRSHASTMTSLPQEELLASVPNLKTDPSMDTSPGPRASQCLHNVENLLNELIQKIFHLSKSCSPPVEVVSQTALESLLQEKLNKIEIQLPLYNEAKPSTDKLRNTRAHSQDDGVVESSVGVIQLPAPVASVPKMPHLHPEQLTSLARVRHGMELLQKRSTQQQSCIYKSLERMETLLVELCGCVQLLSNILNLAMEQEHAVGLHKGFKTGYREGFSHGHFMGVQEGTQMALKKSESTKKETSTQTDKLNFPEGASTPNVDCNKTASEKVMVASATQTTELRRHHKETCTNSGGFHKLRDFGMQTNEPEKTYEQWIHEMLHSDSGQIFLERVELSLNKALRQQKKRLDELYNVKLRHHNEMLRLSRRQSSWRALCRRVERDSKSSTEAKDLVHKIFRLLDHYELHHRDLAEKIHETELAAEQAARILPIWSEVKKEVGASGDTGLGILPPTLSTWGGLCNFDATTLTAVDPTLPPFSNQPKLSGCAEKNIEMSLPYQLLTVSTPGILSSVAQPSSASPLRVKLPPSSRFIPLAPSVNSNPQQHSVNTKKPSSLVAPPDKPVTPSTHNFDEALLSAKDRMLSLERESDLLEQSFLSYLERVRSQKPVTPYNRSLQASCLRERQHIHQTLDGFRNWHQKVHLEDQFEELNGDFFVRSAAEAPLSFGSPICLSETDPETYQFTNAIAVARRKLFNEMTSPHLVQPQLLTEGDSCLFRNWFHSNKLANNSEIASTGVVALPSEAAVPPEVPITGTSSNGEINLAIGRATLALETSWVSSSSSSSSTAAGSSNSSFRTLANSAKPSRKLQRSMAKMHQLFGESVKPAKRPMSAPLSCPTELAEPDALRPHTAPRITPVSSPSSPDISYSQEFWKRMHL